MAKSSKEPANVKPASARASSAFPDLAELKGAMRQCARIGALAWRNGMLSGFSGNISARVAPDRLLVTAKGSIKGRLSATDFALCSLTGAVLAGNGAPSSESGLHLALYAAFSECAAILHTHPPYLQALELYLGRDNVRFLDIDLHEARFWRPRLAFVANGKPGAPEIGVSCVTAVRANPFNSGSADLHAAALPQAIWLGGHGLCAFGISLEDCLAISEELEHLAKVQILSRR